MHTTPTRPLQISQIAQLSIWTTPYNVLDILRLINDYSTITITTHNFVQETLIFKILTTRKEVIHCSSIDAHLTDKTLAQRLNKHNHNI